GPEESFVRSILGLEAGDEFGPDLVIRLADGRPERDRNARAVGPAPLHGRDRRFEDAGGGAAPAGMGDGDDAGRFVGEQDGAAVGGGDADGQPRHGSHDRVGAGGGRARGRQGGADRHGGGRRAREGGEGGAGPSAGRRRQARAVPPPLGGSVAGPSPAVEARIDAVGHAAFAGEERVADAG